jgi:hypothetical protein
MRLRPYTLFAAILLCVPSAFADSVVGSSGAGWQSFPTGTGQAYWNNPSAGAQDGSFAAFLAGTGQFAGQQLDSWCCSSSLAQPIGPGYLPYWGMNGGQADQNFYFTNMVGSAFDAVLFSSSTLGPSGSFGWYDVSNPSVLYPIMSGGLTPGTGGMFSGTSDYGLWAQLSNGSYVFTQSSLNTGGLAGQQMFMVGTTSPGGDYGAFFIGVNDPASGTNGFDDLAFQTSPFDPADMPDQTGTQVPEPAGLSLLGIAACAVVAGILRLQRAA